MTRHRAPAGKDDSPGHSRRLAPQFAIYEIGQPPEEQAEGDTASDIIMDAQPAQSILAREVKNAKRHADDPAVEGHATLPQFEDVERVFKNRWLIEKHISQIGRAACREIVCQYVLISVVDVTLKKKKTQQKKIVKQKVR